MARKLRSDEREAVNRQLPASKKRNLGGKSLMVSREDLARTPLGAPPVDYDVRSVYDVRPIAAFDFNICNQKTFDSLTPKLIEMTVPPGFVCVLRKIDLWFEPNPIGSLRSNYNWSLALNGANVNYNENVFFGVAVDDEDVFLLADENNRVGVRFSGTTVANLETIVGFVRFYGTFQLKTEVPLPFEIANPMARGGRGIRPGQLPVREISREPTAQQPTKIPLVQSSIPDKQVAPMLQPLVARQEILKPPFEIRLSRNLVRGVQTIVPVKPKGGGFILLTPQELTTYADFIATLK